MSGRDDDDDREPLRTVTPSWLGGPNIEMDIFGWLIFLILLVVLLPVLPFVALLWLVSKTIDFLQRQTT